jgi:HAMP domain-containing protein
MNRLVAIAIALLLALPPAAVGQTSDPFGPLPSDPVPPEQPEPTPPPEPVDEDNDLGTAESLGLAGLAAIVIGAVFVAILREGRRIDRRARQAHRGRRGRRSARPTDLQRGTAATATAGEPRAGAKRPPPPPRKRRAKAKRR